MKKILYILAVSSCLLGCKEATKEERKKEHEEYIKGYHAGKKISTFGGGKRLHPFKGCGHNGGFQGGTARTVRAASMRRR